MQIDQVFEELLAKMEVLSVQNHYQGQYGIIGSSKGKDWTSPLTPPSSLSVVDSRSGQHHHHQHQSSSRPSGKKTDFILLSQAEESRGNLNYQHERGDFDVVDGRMTQHNSPQKPQQQQQQHFYHQNQHAHQQQYFYNSNNQHQQYHLQQQQQHQQQYEELGKADNLMLGKPIGGFASTYNNNLFYCDPSPADDVTSPTMAEMHFGISTATIGGGIGVGVGGGGIGSSIGDGNVSDIDEIDEAMVNEISQRLQSELRAAKSRHLDCTEVSLPCYLTPRIAREIVKTSEREPCGVRGCSIFIEFEDEPNNTRRIASFKVDPDTVPTFELYLTLKQDRSGWISLIPQFLRNLTRSSTILISPEFTLTKNKLYSCE